MVKPREIPASGDEWTTRMAWKRRRAVAGRQYGTRRGSDAMRWSTGASGHPNAATASDPRWRLRRWESWVTRARARSSRPPAGVRPEQPGCDRGHHNNKLTRRRLDSEGLAMLAHLPVRRPGHISQSHAGTQHTSRARRERRRQRRPRSAASCRAVELRLARQLARPGQCRWRNRVRETSPHPTEHPAPNRFGWTSPAERARPAVTYDGSSGGPRQRGNSQRAIRRSPSTTQRQTYGPPRPMRELSPHAARTDAARQRQFGDDTARLPLPRRRPPGPVARVGHRLRTARRRRQPSAAPATPPSRRLNNLRVLRQQGTHRRVHLPARAARVMVWNDARRNGASGARCPGLRFTTAR